MGMVPTLIVVGVNATMLLADKRGLLSGWITGAML
jgi:hypothetical protein